MSSSGKAKPFARNATRADANPPMAPALVGAAGRTRRVSAERAYAEIPHAKSVTSKFVGAGNVASGRTRGISAVNLAEIINGHDGERVAIVGRNRTTSYAELNDLVARARGGLVANGIADGDRIAIICSNGLPFVVGYLATLGVGAVAVPLNPSSPASELARQIETVGAVAAMIDRTGAAAWRDLDQSSIPSLRTMFAADGADVPGAVDAAEVMASAPAAIADVDPEHLAALLFTSGTAGAPRAAMLTHGSMRANLDQARTGREQIAPGDVVYGVIPLYHIYGLNVVLGQSLLSGATLLLVQRFDPATAIESVHDRQISVLFGAPSMWVAFSQFEEAPADSFAPVRVAYSGAAKLPIAVAERLEHRFGLVVAEGYGLTEASPVVTSSTGLTPRHGSVGAVLDGIDLRIVDESGDDVLVGDAGELWVRGPNVFAGYLDDPAATERVLTPDGWLRTGDIGYCDEDGYVYLVDRAKDLIIVSGFNVFPAEVEDVLLGHPGVVEAGVIGVPHPHTGEAVKAFVVAAEGSDLDEETLIEYTRDHLARYKCPNKVVIVDELPRNAAGKLLRRSLDDAIAS
jgi:long-chain acyl-CoA synthetase